MIDPVTMALGLVAIVTFLYLGPGSSSRNAAAAMVVASMAILVVALTSMGRPWGLMLVAVTMPISLLTYWRALRNERRQGA
jgi:predicted branched-subunit amino acid permease